MVFEDLDSSLDTFWAWQHTLSGDALPWWQRAGRGGKAFGAHELGPSRMRRGSNRR